MSSDRPDHPGQGTGPPDRDETVSLDKGQQAAAGYDPTAWSSPQQPQQYPHDQYGQDQYGQAQYGQAQYGQAQYGQAQYGQQPYGGYGATPYGQGQYTQPAYGQPGPYGQPGYDQAAYAQQYPQGAYAQPGAYGAPYPAPRGTNTLAIVALIFAFVFPLVGLILGFVARGHIRRTGEEGDGLALAAVIIGGIFTLIALAFIVFFFVVVGAAATSIPSYSY